MRVVCRLFDLALGFQQNFLKVILEYKSIHSFNKYLLRDEAPSKKPRRSLLPGGHATACNLLTQGHGFSLFYYYLVFPLFNDLEITLLISVFLVVAIEF